MNQATAEATFRAAAGALGALAPRLPDGEVGERFHWMLFQGKRLEATPGLVRVDMDPILHEGFDLRPLILDGTVEAAELQVPALGYAEAALESYAVFARLKAEGVIPRPRASRSACPRRSPPSRASSLHPCAPPCCPPTRRR